MLLVQTLKDRSAPPAPGARTEALAQLAGSNGLVDFDEPDDFAAADVEAKADWSVEIHVFYLLQVALRREFLHFQGIRGHESSFGIASIVTSRSTMVTYNETFVRSRVSIIQSVYRFKVRKLEGFFCLPIQQVFPNQPSTNSPIRMYV